MKYTFSTPLTYGRRLHEIEAPTVAKALEELLKEIVDPTLTLEEARGFTIEWRLEKVEK